MAYVVTIKLTDRQKGIVCRAMDDRRLAIWESVDALKFGDVSAAAKDIVELDEVRALFNVKARWESDE